MKNCLVTFVLLQFLAMALPVQAEDRPLTARPEATPVVIIDRQRAAILGIKISIVEEAVEKFFQTHKNFKDEELHSLLLTTEDGRKIKLSQIATIEMKPASPGKPPQ